MTNSQAQTDTAPVITTPREIIKNKSLKVLADKIRLYMDDDSLVWQKGFISARQANAKSGREYNGINAFITSLVSYFENYRSPYWLTFKQIADMGGRLKDAKGKGVPIIFYSEITKNEGAENEYSYHCIKHSYVFNADLVEGVEIKESAALNENDERPTAQAIVQHYLSREGIKCLPGKPAYFPGLDHITMPDLQKYKNSESYYLDLFHEMAHSTGHEKRLNRKEINESKSRESYSCEELTAEMTACFVAHIAGVETEDNIRNSAAYIRGWSNYIKDNEAAFINAISAAYKAKDFILK